MAKLKRIRCNYALADQMLETQGRLQQAISGEDKKFLEQRMAIIDKQIDKAVYQLYGLTEEEVKIVEGGKDDIKWANN